ncbi:MAG: alpha-1,2-fucosyltransferase [bacterium]
MKKKKFCGEIITEMGAGLGNQMNIYAAVRNFSIKRNVDLYLDLTWFSTWPKYIELREFGLKKFNINAKIAKKSKIRKYIFRTKIRYLNGLLRRLKIKGKRVFDEGKDFNNVNEFLSLPINIYVRGYFNLGYFRDIRKTLKKEFVLKDKKKIAPILKEVKKNNSVAVHVRRGDLLKLKKGYVLPMGYYKKAFSFIEKRVTNPLFFVFSDDIGWCEKNLKWIGNVRFIKGNSVEEDFEIMKNCKHKIIANSSLSWWAAYLSDFKNEIVISPRHLGGFYVDDKEKLKEIEKKILPEWVIVE